MSDSLILVSRPGTRYEVLKATDDDWVPSWTLGCFWKGRAPGQQRFVKLICVPLYPASHTDVGSPVARVAAWGNDDFGMEKDYLAWENAFFMFIELLELETVNKSHLLERGFEYV